MPRPGPRPYECVKRAWHSDRHQPMRGSIIQQIFRVVNETHKSATKKNKEWQEKLPIVVLKAEEIMYSKANSEAEYMNLDTLWERLNDAINTIIRRDESAETGDFLPPCVEAALNLGCIPVRASRSQRHMNPTTYLGPRVQEQAPLTPRDLDLDLETSVEGGCPRSSSVSPANQSSFARTMTNMVPIAQSNCPVTENSGSIASRSRPFMQNQVIASQSGRIMQNQAMRVDINSPVDLGTVYPVYYGAHHQPLESQTGSRVQENSNSKAIITGTPIGKSIAEPAEMRALRNPFSSTGVDISCGRVGGNVDREDEHEKPLGTQCDLSLRLGLSSDASVRGEKRLVRESEDFVPSSSQEGSRYNDVFRQKSKELCFFPAMSTSDPVNSSSRNLFLESEGQDREASTRKRKAPLGENSEDGQFCWQSEPPSDQYTSGINRPGS